MNILHISYQWPNIIYTNSGIFIKSTLHNLIGLTGHKYFLFIANKIINKDYLKEKKFTFRNYLSFLSNKDYYSGEKNLVAVRKLYFPFFGITSLSGYNASLCWLFVQNSLISFIKKNEINLIHAHFSNPDGYLALKIKKRLGIPFVMHLHGRDVQDYSIMNNKEKSLVKTIYQEADHVICNSNKTKDLLEKITGRNTNVSVISFGIDIPLNEYSDQDLHDPIRIISIANLVKIKGIQYVLDALGQIKDDINFTYTIIGDGPMMGQLQELVTKLDLSTHVNFMGRQDHETVIKFMKKSDTFILPSYNEAFGIVYLEALACGCAVIGVRKQGCEDINQSGECIYLAEPEDASSILKIIKEVIHNPLKRLAFRKTGYNIIKEIYTWDNICRKLNDIYLQKL